MVVESKSDRSEEMESGRTFLNEQTVTSREDEVFVCLIIEQG